MPPPAPKHRLKNERSSGAPAVGEARADGLAKVPICREGAHYGLGVTSVECGVMAAHHITRAIVSGLQYGRPDLILTLDGHMAEVAAEYDRPIVTRFGDDRHRPTHFPPDPGQVDQQLDYGPPADNGGGHGLRMGVTLRQQRLTTPDELPQLLVATDLASAGVVDHHLGGPHSLQTLAVTAIQGLDVLRDRISLTYGTSLHSHQLHGVGEVRQPGQSQPPVSDLQSLRPIVLGQPTPAQLPLLRRQVVDLLGLGCGVVSELARF